MAASVGKRPYTGMEHIVFGTLMSSPELPLHSDSSSDDEEYGKLKDLIHKGMTEVEPSIFDPRDEGTSDSWIQRNATLVRLTGRTGPVPRARWEDWTVEVLGLVKRPARFTMDKLVHDFPSCEFPATLVCSSNRRKEQNMVKQTIGFNWGPAAISTTVWRGVPLRSVLKRCGIYSRTQGALHVCFEGAEELPGGGGSKYGTGILREVAMDPTRDIILAYMQDGEPLSPDHGFPLRVIVPGFTAGRTVKWLKRIIVTTEESDSYYHYNDNRVLPSHVDVELANAEGWLYKPEYVIYELNINSVIAAPGHDEILLINACTTQRPYVLKGYAYSGGGRKVTRVEVTMDNGETWQVCTLDHQEKPNKYGKYWCWCFWSLEVEVLALLGAMEIAVCAWDQAHNTQPEKLTWNLMGMMNNCWFKVKTNVCKPHKGEIGIEFEHPTQPGNDSGGWMAKERQVEKSLESNPIAKKTVPSSFMNIGSKMYTMSEVKKHNNPNSAWIIVRSHVYDCTHYLKDHPGGVDSILINAGDWVLNCGSHHVMRPQYCDCGVLRNGIAPQLRCVLQSPVTAATPLQTADQLLW